MTRTGMKFYENMFMKVWEKFTLSRKENKKIDNNVKVSIHNMILLYYDIHFTHAKISLWDFLEPQNSAILWISKFHGQDNFDCKRMEFLLFYFLNQEEKDFKYKY